MCLVNGIEGNLDRLEKLDILFLRQRFGGDIEQLCLAVEHILLHLLDALAIERGVEEVSHGILFTIMLDGIDLVLHQGNERRDDNGRPFHQQCRQLVAHGLSTAGWHEHKRVVAIQQVLNNGFLIALERVKAEIVLQGFLQGFVLFLHD